MRQNELLKSNALIPLIQPQKINNFLHYDNSIKLCDSLSGMKLLKNQSADIIIIDPPYNIGKDFGNNKDDLPLEEYLDWCRKWVKECFRILKPNGVGYIYGYSEILARISSFIPLHKQKWLVWHYKNKTVPTLNFWQRSHESIIMFWNNKPPFNVDDVRIPYTDSFLKNSAGKVRNSKKCRYSNGNTKTIYTAHKNGALPRDVIEISTLAGGKGATERFFYCKTCKKLCNPRDRHKHDKCDIIIHPTQKPMKLTEKLIKSILPKSDNINVLIPFVGSGSECVVAKKMGLNFIGFEINKEYITLANEWLKY